MRSSTGSPSSRPNIRDSILFRNVQTPLDIERTTGLTEGNIFQGELTLEQLFFNRPAPGLRPVPDAGPRPLAVRLVDPSGRRDHGRERPDRRPRGAPLARPAGGLTAWPTRVRRRSSSAAGTTRSSPRRISRGPGERVARPGAARSRRRRGRDRRARRRPRAAARRHGRAAPAVGRQGSRPALARPAAGRAGRPGLRAAARRPGDHALGRPGPDRRRPPRVVRPRRRRVPGLRPARPVARPVPRRARRRDAAGHQVARDRRRAHRAEARPDVPRPRQARRPHDPAGPADGRRGLRRRGVRDRRPAGRDRLARRPLLVPRAVVGRLDGDPARRRRPATTAARPARPCSRSAGPARCREALASAARAAGAEIRCDADVVAITSRDNRVTGVALASGEEIAAPVVVSGARPEADAGRARRPGDDRAVDALAGRQLPDAGRRGQGQPRRSIGCRRFTGRRRRRRAAPPRPDPRRARDRRDRARLRRREVRPRVATTPVLEATIPSLVDPSLVDGAPRRDARHERQRPVRAVPRCATATWDDAGRADAFGDRVVGGARRPRARARVERSAPAR